MHINVFLCVCADGSMRSVRVCTQRMRWNKLLMKALHAHPAPHMFQNLWVSHRIYKREKDNGFKDIHRIFLYVLLIFLMFLSLVFAFDHSSRVSHYGFNKDQRAR